MAAEADNPKWQGKAIAKLLKPTAEEVWPFLEDFCSIHKWIPSIDTCFKVEGDEGRRGLVRYCAAMQPPPPDGGEGVVKWCHERLLAVDTVGKCLSYEVLDNNLGFRSYESTLKVVPIEGGDCPSGCQIEWSFVADPVEGLGCGDLVAYLDFNLQRMAKNLEKALE